MTDNRCFVFTANSGADAGQAAEIEVYKAK